MFKTFGFIEVAYYYIICIHAIFLMLTGRNDDKDAAMVMLDKTTLLSV